MMPPLSHTAINMNREPAAHNMVLTRVFAVPVEQLWAAWTQPELVMDWWGPAGFTCPLANMDVHIGGVSLVCMRAPAEYGGQDLYNTWSYTRIVPGERLEYVNRFSDAAGAPLDPAQLGLPPGVPAEVPHVVTFRALDAGRTELTVTEFGYPTVEARDLSQSGMVECLDKLEALFR
jgi:uncharacterized protein YndB with AHSA1/START domain